MADEILKEEETVQAEPAEETVQAAAEPAEEHSEAAAEPTEEVSAEQASGEEAAEEEAPPKNWYVVHTYSGYENKVKANIEKAIENRRLEDRIVEVRVPMQDVIEVKNGKRKPVQRKMFPGYVLVNMDMDDETWYVVRNTRGVTGFVGPGSKPVPLSDAEIKPLGIHTTTPTNVDFEIGDTIAVVAGVWKGTTGIVKRMDMGKQTATINVELFGRETPVEISFAEVRKVHR